MSARQALARLCSRLFRAKVAEACGEDGELECRLPPARDVLAEMAAWDADIPAGSYRAGDGRQVGWLTPDGRFLLKRPAIAPGSPPDADKPEKLSCKGSQPRGAPGAVLAASVMHGDFGSVRMDQAFNRSTESCR